MLTGNHNNHTYTTIINGTEYYNYLYINYQHNYYNSYIDYIPIILNPNFEQNDNWSNVSTTDCADYDDRTSLIDDDNDECLSLVDSD